MDHVRGRHSVHGRPLATFAGSFVPNRSSRSRVLLPGLDVAEHGRVSSPGTRRVDGVTAHSHHPPWAGAPRPSQWASEHHLWIIVLSLAVGIAGCAIALSIFEHSPKSTEQQLTVKPNSIQEAFERHGNATEEQAQQEGEAEERTLERKISRERMTVEAERKATLEAEAAERQPR
jgi:hypothetical protein